MTKEYIMQRIKWHEEAITKLERELREISNKEQGHGRTE